jgi:sugar/nucleoside kinase (ribokinase family)
LAESPVFDNRETPAGRTQTCLAPGQRLPVADLPATWRAAPAWSLVPVAGEVDDAWASLVPEPAFVALGWQGWLRDLVAGCDVARRTPTSSLLLRRADLVGVSRHDLPPEANPRDLRRLLGPRAVLLVTDGERGGCLLRAVDDEAGQSWRYEAVPPDREIDSTGAGDTYLGTLLATLVHPSLIGDSEADLGADLAFAAAAASLVIERPGLLGVPDVAAARARWRRDRPGRLEPSR